MDRLAAMQVFVRVVDRASFTMAADELNMSRAMASKHVQDLEESLGARLLNRTTRRVGLTESGRAFYERCVQILADVAEAEQEVGRLHGEPRGILRVNAPVSFGVRHLAPAITAFTLRHPAVSVELVLNDRLVDLIEEGYDLAIRIARLADSSLMARRLAPCRLLVCAAPSYLGAYGTPRCPQDLVDHNCLTYTYAAHRDEWQFTGPEGAVGVRVAGNLRANNGDVLRAAALCGQGVVILPSLIVGEDVAAGQLVRLLPEWEVPQLDIHAIYPPGRRPSAKLRAFIDFLAGRYGDNPPWDCWMSSAS